MIPALKRGFEFKDALNSGVAWSVLIEEIYAFFVGFGGILAPLVYCGWCCAASS